MSDALFNPVFQSANRAITNRVLDAMALTGKSLPCHVTKVNGAMITVAFDVLNIHTLPTVTIPLFGPEYIRYPIKENDLGVAIAVDARIGYTSGQTSAISDLSPPANLSALYFQPIGNKNWTAVDPAQVDIYAPNGVKIHDTASGAIINLLPTSVEVTVGETTFLINGSSIIATTTNFTINAPTITLNGQLTQGTNAGGFPATLQGPVTVVHEVTANNIPLSSHLHINSGGTGNSGTPIA